MLHYCYERLLPKFIALDNIMNGHDFKSSLYFCVSCEIDVLNKPTKDR